MLHYVFNYRFIIQLFLHAAPAFAQSSYFVNETAGYVEICTVFTIDGDSALTVNATLNLPTLSGNATCMCVCVCMYNICIFVRSH